MPASPEVTAQQIAGAAGQCRRAQAMAAAGQPGQPMPGEGQGQQPGQGQGAVSRCKAGRRSTASKGGAAKGGEYGRTTRSRRRANLTARPSRRCRQPRREGRSATRTPPGSKFDAEPWFAKLPPGLRAAIQAKARGKAPRGYEERLRRYFESVD